MKNIILILFLFCTSSIFGQGYLGLSQGNYAGALGIDFNPANVADNRMEMDLSINGSSPWTLTITSASISKDASATLSVPVKHSYDV